jgi:hypothetical protein
MSAAQIAFDMEVGEAFEYRENEYREKTKAAAVKAVEERAAKAAAAEERAAKAAAKRHDIKGWRLWPRTMPLGPIAWKISPGLFRILLSARKNCRRALQSGAVEPTGV